MSFPYKCVLMIGATSGIGLGMAEKLVLEGSKVIVSGRRKDRLDSFVNKHGKDKSGAIVFDIDDTQGLPKFVETVTQAYPELDCVFLNAGFQREQDLTKMSAEDLATFHQVISTNFTSYVNVTHAFLPFLEAQKSRTSLIYTGSNIAIVPAASLPAYCASKSALNTYVLCLREQLEHAKSNVAVIEVSPPPVQTEIHDATMGAEKGRAFGMPLDAFTDQAYAEMVSGKTQIIVGSIGPEEEFLEVVDKRRKIFDWLSAIMRQS